MERDGLVSGVCLCLRLQAKPYAGRGVREAVALSQCTNYSTYSVRFFFFFPLSPFFFAGSPCLVDRQQPVRRVVQAAECGGLTRRGDGGLCGSAVAVCDATAQPALR